MSFSGPTTPLEQNCPSQISDINLIASTPLDIIHHVDALQASGSIQAAPLLHPRRSADVELRHPSRLKNSTFLTQAAVYDSGSDGDLIHPDVVTSAIQAGVISHDDVHEFLPKIVFTSIDGGPVSSDMLVDFDVLIPENRSATVRFLICDHISKNSIYLGNPALTALGLWSCYSTTRSLPRPDSYTLQTASVSALQLIKLQHPTFGVPLITLPHPTFGVPQIPAPSSSIQSAVAAIPILQIPNSAECSIADLLSLESPVSYRAASCNLVHGGHKKFTSLTPVESHSLIEEKPTEDGRVQLMVRCPQIEAAVVDPVRNPRANMTAGNNLAKSIKLAEMCQLNQIEVVDAKDCHYIEATVLVDKTPDVPPLVYDTADHSGSKAKIMARYRLTLFARRSNLMIAVLCPVTGNILHKIPSLEAKQSWPDSVEAQYQSSGFESLSQIPGTAMFWFAKVDVKSGFPSIVLHPDPPDPAIADEPAAQSPTDRFREPEFEPLFASLNIQVAYWSNQVNKPRKEEDLYCSTAPIIALVLVRLIDSL